MTFLKTAALVFATSLMLWSQVGFARREGVQNLPGSSWRFWDDMTLAIARYVDLTSDKPPLERADANLSGLVDIYRVTVEDKARNFELEPHQFWRTVNDRKFRVQHAPFGPPPKEDQGRSLLLLLGFRILDGVAPHLLLWVGVLAFVPVFAWVSYEFVASGLTAAGVAFALLVSLSPFWIECLSLPHSALAFYLGALVALAAFALAVFMPRRAGPLDWRPLALRAVFLSSILIVAIWCRSGAVFFLPTAFLIGVWGFWRGGLAKMTAVALAAGIFVFPALAFRPHQTHNVWVSLWEGLGDFGSDRGYSWYDKDAGQFLATQGLPRRTELRYVSAQEEGIFKDAFLSGVLRSPLWYAAVLTKRVGATLGLTHLSPYGPTDGRSLRTPLFHYKYSTPIDWFGWKDRTYEVPTWTLYLPTLLLLLWGLFDPGRILGEGGVLVAVASAALPVPLLVSTASGLETQGFALAYFLGAAFLVQRAADTVLRRIERA